MTPFWTNELKALAKETLDLWLRLRSWDPRAADRGLKTWNRKTRSWEKRPRGKKGTKPIASRDKGRLRVR